MSTKTLTSIRFVCFAAVALAGGVSAEDDMPMQPAPAPAHAAPAHPDDGMGATHVAAPAPDAMAVHLDEMATQLRTSGEAMAAMGRRMMEQSGRMHQRAMALRSGEAAAGDDMDALAAMQHLERMKHDLQHWEMQSQQVDSTMQMMDSSMGGMPGQKKDHM